MSEQALDLRRSAQIVRRHKIVVGIFAALGLLAGVRLHRCSVRRCSPARRSSMSCFRPRSRAAQVGGNINPALATQIVIAASDPSSRVRCGTLTRRCRCRRCAAESGSRA